MTIDARFSHSSIIAVIKEHGPLTRTELFKRILGYPFSQRLERALEDMESQNLITYRRGFAKKTGKEWRVYTAVSQ